MGAEGRQGRAVTGLDACILAGASSARAARAKIRRVKVAPSWPPRRLGPRFGVETRGLVRTFDCCVCQRGPGRQKKKKTLHTNGRPTLRFMLALDIAPMMGGRSER